MAVNQITILSGEPIGVIAPELYGHFAEHLGGCVYGGLWVGPGSNIPNDGGLRLDVLAALKKIAVPVLRWPGGCFADDYHWEDGVGPDRPRRVNAWWGHDVEDNSFGTHEFLRLCQLLGAKPYLAGNVGSGTPRELRQWIEYCNLSTGTSLSDRRRANGRAAPFDVRWWGVGNESWGCGGNLSPEEYAAEYKKFVTFAQTWTREPTRMPLKFVACGPNGNDPDWTRRFFTAVAGRGGDFKLDGYAAHYYAGTAGTATEFDSDQWYQLLHRGTAVERLILDQRSLMDEFDPARKVGLIVDEWGTWHPPAPGKPANHLWQQNTLRDALLAAMTLDTFNRHADKVVMANLAQVVNVLQAVVLTERDRMLLTPTYHVFDAYQSHQGGTSLRTVVESRTARFAAGDTAASFPAVAASASVKAGHLTVTVTNAHTSAPAEMSLHWPALTDVSVRTITHDDLTAHNTFDAPTAVAPTTKPWRPADRYEFPPASVTVFHGHLA